MWRTAEVLPHSQEPNQSRAIVTLIVPMPFMATISKSLYLIHLWAPRISKVCAVPENPRPACGRAQFLMTNSASTYVPFTAVAWNALRYFSSDLYCPRQEHSHRSGSRSKKARHVQCMRCGFIHVAPFPLRRPRQYCHLIPPLLQCRPARITGSCALRCTPAQKNTSSSAKPALSSRGSWSKRWEIFQSACRTCS